MTEVAAILVDIGLMFCFGASVVHFDFSVLVIARDEVIVVGLARISYRKKCGFSGIGDRSGRQAGAFARIPWALDGINI